MNQSFWVSRLYNIPEKLGLSQNAKKLLKALDDVEQGIIDETDLGRQIRLSSSLRRTIPETITQCTETMTKDPKETPSCVQMIERCTRILKIADLGPLERGFPFLKLPFEVRTQIYNLCFGKCGSSITLTSHDLEDSCRYGFCLPQPEALPKDRLDTSITSTCHRIRDEALPLLYSQRTLSFSCTCTMAYFLEDNKIGREHVRNIRFHWCGPGSGTAISKLASCPELKGLIVRISKMTTYEMTERETKMRQFFKSQKNNPRLCDARGIEELMAIRGLDTVTVDHVPGRHSARRTDEDKYSLKRLLDSKLLLKKPHNYGQTSGSS